MKNQSFTFTARPLLERYLLVRNPTLNKFRFYRLLRGGVWYKIRCGHPKGWFDVWVRYYDRTNFPFTTRVITWENYTGLEIEAALKQKPSKQNKRRKAVTKNLHTRNISVTPFQGASLQNTSL